MADLTYSVEVTTAQAERNLAQLQRSVGTLNDSFAGLKQALAGIAIGQFITNSLNLASRVDALGKATGIATENIRGFQLAVGQAGGNSDQASDAISDLVKNIGDAANGSSELVAAFRTAGVSLNDLRTLSEQDILAKTIQGIAKIGDASTQSSVKAKIFGEALKNVNMNSVAANIGSLSAESGKYAAAATAAREAQLKMNQAIDKLQESVVIALAPINNFIASIDPQAITAFANTLVTLAKVFVGLYVVEKLTTVVSAFGLAATATTGKLGNLANALGKTESARAYTQGLNTIKRELSEMPAVFDRAFNPERFRGKDVGFKMIGNAFSMMGLGLARMLPLIGQVVTGIVILDGVVAGLTGKDLSGWFNTIRTSVEQLLNDYFPKLSEQLDKINKKLGFGPSPSQQAAAEKAALNHLANLKEEQAEIDAVRNKQAEVIRGQEALARLSANIAKQAAAYKLVNAEHIQYTDRLKTSMGFQTGLIGLTQDQVELETNLRQEAERYQDVVIGLTKKQQELRNSMIGEKDSEKVKLYASEINEIGKTIGVVSDQHLKNREIIERQTNAIQGARLVEQARLQNIQNTTKAIEDQTARQQALGDIIRQANQQAVEVTERPRASQTVGLNSIQKQILDIQESARKAAIEAARSFAANFEDNGDGLTPERARELAQGLDQIAGAYKRVATAQIEVAEANYETARSFSTGWKEAFAKYAEDAQDSSKQAATYFERFTQGFEDAIVAFVTKGKFSFKDFANSIIADFARIQARRALTNFMTGGGGTSGNVMGNLFAFGKSLFGFANGGMMQAGQPGVVGERGPELFVPQTAGKVISNAEAFGNRQPQIINNAVTYEIQAVDASSFRSLIARDPNFIYAVTEQGRRNQPTRRSA
jgi:lambda family phage tail tape measure protein